MSDRRRANGVRNGAQARRTAPPTNTGPRIGPFRITPTGVLLVIALIGSLAYFLYALTVREATQIPLTRVRGGTAVWTGGAAGGTSGPAPVAPGDGARSGSGTPLRSSYIGPVMVAIYPGRPPVMPGTTPACSGSGTPVSVVEEC